MSKHRSRALVIVLFAIAATSLLTSAAPAAVKVDRASKRPVPVPQLYLSPKGSDSGRCTKGSPCASFARAFAVAKAGELVEVADGYYGNCSKPLTGAKADFVTFRAARGASPWTTCPLTLLRAEHVRFVNLKLDGIYLYSTQYVTLDHVNVTCRDEKPFTLYGPTQVASFSPGPVSPSGYYCSAFVKGTPKHFKMIGGSIGPTLADGCVGSDASDIGFSAPEWIADDLLFDGVTVHTARFRGKAPAGCGEPDPAHTELFYFTAVRNVTIRNSRFYDGGSSADIFITDQNQGVRSQNIRIENNIFDRSVNMPINVSYVQGLRIAYNTFPFGGPGWIAAGTNVSIIGNLGEHNLCPAPPGVATYSHNVWFLDNSTGGSADRCGSTDVALNSNGSNIFVKMAPRGNFQLRKGSPAVGRGDPNDYPLRDRTGTCRPQGKQPDAGAFEQHPVRKSKKAQKVAACRRR